MNTTLSGNITNINIAVEFPPHPLPDYNYTASIVVINNEGESPSTSKLII